VRTLVLIRHAKSDYPGGVADADRPLSARGERDAAAAAQWLAAAYPVVDEVAVSPARRAQQTWSVIGAAVDATTVRTDPRVYEDWGVELRRVVAELNPASESAIIVGHNPGIEDLAATLAGRALTSAKARMTHKYPTSGIAIVNIEGAWSEPTSTRLSVFAVPRGSN
jgi:phosphohistidine phosphatase